MSLFKLEILIVPASTLPPLNVSIMQYHNGSKKPWNKGVHEGIREWILL